MKKQSVLQSIRVEENGWKELLEKTTDWVWSMDQQGCFNYCSDAVKYLLGYEPKDLLGKEARNILAMEDREELDCLFMPKERKPFSLMITRLNYRHKSGNLIAMENHVLPIMDGDGMKLQGYQCVSNMLCSNYMVNPIFQEAPANKPGSREYKKFLHEHLSHLINNPNTLIMMNARVLAEIWLDVAKILDKHAEQETIHDLAGLPYEELRDVIPKLISDIYEGAGRIDSIIRELSESPGNVGKY